ncbi:bifunctional adenosylcobinamide kinase/adenosylcobinamide-phosphate guanylyltransferase [Margalitia sp. FSL K6-0131]|uniref:bifunctional adenosylcobinamide kinase/adenosylcobinamide-phosphate guanylyltransferase n=1 Tax=Margalitia sp. FSL K6-0131 TaxID=2954604 RepID=UPI0030F53CDF
MEKAQLIFISGGVRSGKSSFAEKLAIEYAKQQNKQLNYLACGRASDTEMASRIQHHQETRRTSGLPWKNWECPVDIKGISPAFSKGDVVLLDCLTTLLNNELFQSGSSWEQVAFQQNVYDTIMAGIDAIQEQCSVLIIVSNEVLNEELHKGELVYTYAKLLGHLHQSIIQQSAVAYLVDAGIPFLMKGEQTDEWGS